MILPPEYAWLELVVIGAVAVFVADLIGNLIAFRGRFANAFTTGLSSLSSLGCPSNYAMGR